MVWNTTSHCNLRCIHCYFDAAQAKEPNELSCEEARNFIEDLAKLNVPVLLFSGGEPLLREDIFELGKFANDKGIRAVLCTNGTLITQKAASEIKKAGFSYVGISLDGGGQSTNDKFRRDEGAFSAALTGLRHCKDVGLKVGLRFALTRYNFKELPDIFDLLERESIPRLCICHLVYPGRGRGLREDDLSHKEKRESLEIIWQRTTDFAHRRLNIEVLTVDNYWHCETENTCSKAVARDAAFYMFATVTSAPVRRPYLIAHGPKTLVVI